MPFHPHYEVWALVMGLLAAYVVAARETSIVFSILIGGIVFGEGRVLGRLAAAALILAGVACVALAR